MVGFFHIFSLLHVPTNTQCRYARNATKPQFLLGFKHFEEKAHKAENNQNKQKIDDKMQVLRDIDFEGILDGFREGFGRPKSMIFAFFREKMEAKNKMIFGRQKDRILRPQEQIADELRRYVRVRGKEHRMGGRPFRKESRAHNLELLI